MCMENCQTHASKKKKNYMKNLKNENATQTLDKFFF